MPTMQEMNFKYKKLEDIERHLMLSVMDGIRNPQLNMMMFIIHQHEKACDILQYLVVNNLIGKRFFQTLADFDFDYDKMINRILQVSKNRIILSK